MNIEKTARQMLDIISAVIKGEKLDISTMDIDWDEIVRLCDFHGITNLIAYAADGSVPKEYADRLHQSSAIAMSRTMQFEFATNEICEAFEKNKISYMILKGYIMKNYYPSPEMRTMCDVDMLTKQEDFEKINQVMAQLGYIEKNPFNRNDERSFHKPPLLSFDMHTQLVSDSHVKLKEYYGNGWHLAKQATEYGYVMSDEDFFIFLIAHMAKHYSRAGIGVKHVIDIWIYINKFTDSLDWEYVNIELEKLKLREFTDKVVKLTKVWFENEKPDEISEAMGNYILLSGMYGTNVNAEKSNKMRSKNKLLYSINKHFKVLFTGRKDMEKLYPVLKKRPYLLGYYRIKRIITKLFDGSGTKYLKNQSTINSDKINETQSHFKSVGLDNYIE